MIFTSFGVRLRAGSSKIPWFLQVLGCGSVRVLQKSPDLYKFWGSAPCGFFENLMIFSTWSLYAYKSIVHAIWNHFEHQKWIRSINSIRCDPSHIKIDQCRTHFDQIWALLTKYEKSNFQLNLRFNILLGGGELVVGPRLAKITV